MEYQYLIEKMQKIEALFPNIYDLFEQEIQQLKAVHGLDSAVSLSTAFEKISTSDRFLNIGIVGRVKAGKSSLLNALFFDGENTLPKAATPMTAALTTLSWGEQFRATIEFYTASDLKQIEFNASKYVFELNKIKDQKYAEFTSRSQTGAAVDEERILAFIEKQAIQQAQSTLPELSASFDQSSRMKASGLTPADLEQMGVLEPENYQSLSTQLVDYVGAEGKYMPFTKAVHISMPVDALKNISVIDTPGMNDPVQSREARTVELLKTCDVIFIVSPAGQFLNENDIELMGRITAKEGVQELVLVASQVDTQLYGSEKRPVLDQTLASIRASLMQRASSTLSGLKRQSPEMGSVFDNIIRNPNEHLLHCSGVAHGLAQRLDRSDTWDSNEQKTWGNLIADYADWFSEQNHDLTRHSLATLANIATIRLKIEEVRQKKDSIISEKMQHLVAQKAGTLDEFTHALQQRIGDRIALINNTNLDDLAIQSKQLLSKRYILEKRVDIKYSNCVNRYYQGVVSGLEQEADTLFLGTQQKINDNTTTENFQHTREKSGFGNWFARKVWGGGSETYSRTETIVQSGPVSVALKGFITTIEASLKRAGEKQHEALEKEIIQAIPPEIDKILEGESDPIMMAEVILSVVASIPDNRFSLNTPLPKELSPKGRLKGDEADEFMTHAETFAAQLRNTTSDEIRHYIARIEKAIPANISKTFIENMDAKIAQITSQVENSTQTLDRLQRFSAQLQGIR